MKKFFAFLAFALLLSTNLFGQTEPTDIDANGYRNISTLDHLRWVSENPNSWGDNFELDNDIDAAETQTWNDGAGWSPIGNTTTRFTGIFDGRGFVIQNIFINRPNKIL